VQASALVLLPDPTERRLAIEALEDAGFLPFEADPSQAPGEGLEGPAPEVAVVCGELLQDARGRGLLQPTVPAVTVGQAVGGEQGVERPLATSALIAAVRAALQHDRIAVELHDRSVDLHHGSVQGPGGSARLTAREAELFAYLARRRNCWVPGPELISAIWGHASANVVAVTLRRLRAKIEADPAAPRHLLSRRGVGFQLALTPKPERADGPALPLLEDLLGEEPSSSLELRWAQRLWCPDRAEVPGGSGGLP